MSNCIATVVQVGGLVLSYVGIATAFYWRGRRVEAQLWEKRYEQLSRSVNEQR